MMKKGSAASPKTIDDYLATVPSGPRLTLEKLRRTIQSVAPKATEGISYQIPVFKHFGVLVGFAAFKDHCSFFPMNASLIAAHQHELKSYNTSKGTIRFAAEKPLPAALVKKLVRERVKENQARARSREKLRS